MPLIWAFHTISIETPHFILMDLNCDRFLLLQYEWDASQQDPASVVVGKIQDEY